MRTMRCPVSYAWEDCGDCGTKPWLKREKWQTYF